MKIFLIVLCVLVIPFIGIPGFADSFMSLMWQQSPTVAGFVLLGFFMFKLWNAMQKMEMRLEHKMDRMNDQLIHMNRRQDVTDTRVETNVAEIQRVDLKAEARVEALRKELDVKFDKIDARFDKIDERFQRFEEKVDEKFEKLEAKFDARFERMENQNSTIIEILLKMKAGIN
jgi:uncharacterized protein YhaN